MMSRYRMAAHAVANLKPPVGDYPAVAVQPVKGHRSNWVAAGWPSITHTVTVGKGNDRTTQPAKFYPLTWAQAYADALGLPLDHVALWEVSIEDTDAG